MPLYRIDQKRTVSQVKPARFSKEKELHQLFEENLEVLLGVRFLASEFTTGDRQRGRIDTLGLDQDGYPTIIEYKKSNKENVINQGLFYLDWLVDHKGDFTLSAQKACGADVKIDWSHPCLILIAESFSEYDKYAVNRIGANIELWTYRRYGEDLIYLDPLYVAEARIAKVEPIEAGTVDVSPVSSVNDQSKSLLYTVEEHLAGKSKQVQELFESLRERIFALSSDDTIIEKANKMYIGYKHGKNFVEVRIQTKILQIWLDISYTLIPGSAIAVGLSKMTNLPDEIIGSIGLGVSTLAFVYDTFDEWKRQNQAIERNTMYFYYKAGQRIHK